MTGDPMSDGDLCRGNISQDPRHKSRAYILMDCIGQDFLRRCRRSNSSHGSPHNDTHLIRICRKADAGRTIRIVRHPGILP